MLYSSGFQVCIQESRGSPGTNWNSYSLARIPPTVNPKKLETGLRSNSAGIPYTLLFRIEAIGFPSFGLLLYESICDPTVAVGGFILHGARGVIRQEGFMLLRKGSLAKGSAEGHAEGTTCSDSETCQRLEARKAGSRGGRVVRKGFLRP